MLTGMHLHNNMLLLFPNISKAATTFHKHKNEVKFTFHCEFHFKTNPTNSHISNRL